MFGVSLQNGIQNAVVRKPLGEIGWFGAVFQHLCGDDGRHFTVYAVGQRF